MGKYKYRCGSEVEGKPPKPRNRSRRACKSITIRTEEKLSQLENTVKMQQKELRHYKSGNRRLEHKYQKAFNHILKLSKYQQKNLSRTRVNTNRSHSNECVKSPSYKTNEVSSYKPVPLPPKKGLLASHTMKDLSIKTRKRKLVLEQKIKSLQDSVENAMEEFKKIEKKEKSMLSKRIKQIKESFDDKFKDLKERYKRQKRKLEDERLQVIQKEKDTTKQKLEKEVEKLCKYLHFYDTPRCGTVSSDSMLGNNLKDSMLKQSMTGSNYSEIKILNGSQAYDNDKASVFARRASSSFDNIDEIADKENIISQNVGINNILNYTKQPSISNKLGDTFGGFTTLGQNAKNFKMSSNLSQPNLIQGSTDNNLLITSPNSLLNLGNMNHIANISPTLAPKSPIQRAIISTYKTGSSSSESDSDESLTRYIAISPRIRNSISNALKANYLSKGCSIPMTRSCYNINDNLGSSSSNTNLDNKIIDLNTDKEITLCKKNSSSDSDSSDVEMSIIEKGIQMSLEQVTNRLKSYNTNAYNTYSPALSNYNKQFV